MAFKFASLALSGAASGIAALFLAATAPVSAQPDSGSAPVYASLTAARTAPAKAAAAVPGTLRISSIMAINHWLAPGEYAWNDEGVPPGPVTVVADLRSRVMSVYRSGVEIGRSSMIYGADDKPTPTGTFPIMEKKAEHYSRTYNNAPMPWMQRLTRDGIAIHGSKVENDAATHGCLGLPGEFAELLFRATRVGDKVVVVSGPPGGRYTWYAALGGPVTYN